MEKASQKSKPITEKGFAISVLRESGLRQYDVAMKNMHGDNNFKLKAGHRGVNCFA